MGLMTGRNSAHSFQYKKISLILFSAIVLVLRLSCKSFSATCIANGHLLIMSGLGAIEGTGSFRTVMQVDSNSCFFNSSSNFLSLFAARDPGGPPSFCKSGKMDKSLSNSPSWLLFSSGITLVWLKVV